MILQTTLSLAAAAAVINFWLGLRCSLLRAREGVLHGDGGHSLLAKRMRAHANFIEYTPLTLILCALIELSGKGGRWLAIVGAAFMLARVAHAFGMEADKPSPVRAGGIMTTVAVMLGLAIVALLIATGVM